jgi:hypothetical protein
MRTGECEENCRLANLAFTPRKDKISRIKPSQNLTEAGTLRKRAQRACSQCHSQKTKCSGDLPQCKRCESLSLACEYLPAKRKFTNVRLNHPATVAEEMPSTPASVQSPGMMATPTPSVVVPPQPPPAMSVPPPPPSTVASAATMATTSSAPPSQSPNTATSSHTLEDAAESKPTFPGNFPLAIEMGGLNAEYDLLSGFCSRNFLLTLHQGIALAEEFPTTSHGCLLRASILAAMSRFLPPRDCLSSGLCS